MLKSGEQSKSESKRPCRRPELGIWSQPAGRQEGWQGGGSQSGVLSQQHQHCLGTCWKCTLPAPILDLLTQEPWRWDPRTVF